MEGALVLVSVELQVTYEGRAGKQRAWFLFVDGGRMEQNKGKRKISYICSGTLTSAGVLKPKPILRYKRNRFFPLTLLRRVVGTECCLRKDRSVC